MNPLHWRWLGRLGLRGKLALMGLLPMALLLIGGSFFLIALNRFRRSISQMV
jgi:hypothetical protein